MTEDTQDPAAQIALTLNEAETGDIRILVADDEGNGINDVSVVIVGPLEHEEWTNKDGVAVFEDVEIATWEVTVSKPGYQTASATIEPNHFHEANMEFPITFQG